MTIPAPPAPAASKPKSLVSLWSLITGIAALVLGLIPGLSFVAWLPAAVAIILGIVALKRGTPRKGQAQIGIAIGGAGWVIAIVVSILSIVGLFSLGGTSAAAPSATPTAESAAPTMPAPTSEPTPEVSASKPATPQPTTTAGPTDADRAATFQQALSDAFGGASAGELLAQDPSSWAGYVNGVRVERSNVFVTLQVAPDDLARDDLGERAARALSTLIPASAVEGISFIVVEDASGVVIDQTQPAPLS